MICKNTSVLLIKDKRNKPSLIYLFLGVYVWFCQTYICDTKVISAKKLVAENEGKAKVLNNTKAI